ncbi:MAG: FAD-dependent oxidoreductase, partial [Fimbriimonadaceae bacterium]|nr:FAD-dependent oxidoreductase [Fimbriimonadaceae bacterium]
KSSLLRSFFYGFPSYSGQSYRSKAPGALLIPFLMAEGGVYYPEGGVCAIPAALHRLATEIGVVFHFEKHVKSVSESGARISGVEFSDGERVSPDFVVSGIDRLNFERLLGREITARPSYSYFTIHMGVPRAMPQVHHHTLLVPKDAETGFADLYERYRLPSPPVVYLNNPTHLDPSVAPEGSTNLFAVLTVPAEHDHLDWDSEAPRLRETTYDLMKRFGLEVDQEELEFEIVQDPRTFKNRDGSYRGSLYGPDERERHMRGMFPLTNRDPQFQNLFYCGGSVQPGAGLPMAVLSGKFVADLLGKT